MRKLGNVLMILGALLMVAALLLLVYNQQENMDAGKASVELLPTLIESINTPPEAEVEAGTNESVVPPVVILPDPATPVEFMDPSAFEMAEVEIDGYGYIGYLSIPALELELPIMGDWDYTRLRKAPCRYVGSVRGEDLVLMAHNYTNHFGRLSELTQGDTVIFVDVEGNATEYAVVGMDVLAPTAVEEMTSGEFDLTLFTCTYGGRSRVTIYCDIVRG